MRILKPFYVAILLSFFAFSCNSGPGTPNVVLFLVDDYGYGDISFEGNTQIQTPNIDRIAKNGARFTRFYQSGAACAPTRASLLTGRYHLETGVWGVHQGRDFIRLDEKTIGNAMQEAGYATGSFGKWHSGKIWSYCSWNRGFDEGLQTSLYRYFDTKALYNNKVIQVEGPITNVVGDRVVDFIEEHTDSPFFAYVPFQSIHEPYNCPPEVFQKYKDQGYSDHVARLYGMIEVMDENIGRILDVLEEKELMENTIIMFLGDDGPSPGVDLSYRNRRMNAEEKEERTRAWPRHLRGGKGTIWEGGMITPFYIRWDGQITPEKDYAHIAGVIDLYPTILDMCGVSEPSRDLPLHGKSIWPVLTEELDADSWNERFYFDNSNFYLVPRERINMERPELYYIAMQHGDYKLVRVDRRVSRGLDTVYYELYNLAKDPVEEHNIISDEPALADSLVPKLEAWYDGVIDHGRAFSQAVYEVGYPQEPETPLNLDGAKEMYGSVEAESDARWRYTGWTEPGSGITFDINVAEAGEYQVEINYQGGNASSEAEFIVFTEHSKARLRIEDARKALSEPLKLPVGRQTLHLELSNPGEGREAFSLLTGLSVHRVFYPGDRYVVHAAGMQLSAGEESREYSVGSAAADFMYGRLISNPLTVSVGTEILLQPFAENPEVVASMRLFKDFEEQFYGEGFKEEITLHFDEPGFYNLNLEFSTYDGIITVVRGAVEVTD